MEIYLARPRGFCAGVNRAIAIVNRALDRHKAPVYVLHEIVHNTHVIEELRAKGAIFVEQLEDIPRGSVAIFSAHGVSPAIETKAVALGLRVIDATCPLVAMVHRRVSRLNKIGYEVLVIGHKGHPEVEGTCGHAAGRVHIISCPEDVADIAVEDEAKVGYVTQTTLSVDDTREILQAIHQRFPLSSAQERSDICYATTNRQRAVRQLAAQVDSVLVVGSKNSSNSNRLREVARSEGAQAYLIDHAGEIDPAWLHGIERIGITAGASAPEHLVRGVIKHLDDGTSRVIEMEGDEEQIHFHIPDLDV